MKRKSLREFYLSVFCILAFILWTISLKYIDVSAIGPNESEVGFSSINGFFHNLTGANMKLYVITDWLGLVPFFICFGFGIFGLIQWIGRKNILKVDSDILILGGYYIVVMAVYILFEMVVINRRPVLINGFLETSYPSSTTMLVMCVMPTAVMQFQKRIKSLLLKRIVVILSIAFTVFMVVGRLISGVHWLTDIIGGALISIALVTMYHFFAFKES